MIFFKGDMRVTLSGLMALQEVFQDVNLADIHAGRVTIKDKDLVFVKYIQHEDKMFNPSTTPEGVDFAHERQVKNRNKNAEGVDALRQV
jgi:hypothetical protein